VYFGGSDGDECTDLSMLVEGEMMECIYPAQSSSSLTASVVVDVAGQVSNGSSVSYVDDSGSRTAVMEALLNGSETSVSLSEDSRQSAARMAVAQLLSSSFSSITESSVLIDVTGDMEDGSGVIANLSVSASSASEARSILVEVDDDSADGSLADAFSDEGLEVIGTAVLSKWVRLMIFCEAGAAPSEGSDETFSCQTCEAGESLSVSACCLQPDELMRSLERC